MLGDLGAKDIILVVDSQTLVELRVQMSCGIRMQTVSLGHLSVGGMRHILGAGFLTAGFVVEAFGM